MKLIKEVMILTAAAVSLVGLTAQSSMDKVREEVTIDLPLEIQTSVLPAGNLDGMSCGGTLSFPQNHGDIGTIPWFEIDIDFDLSQVESLNFPDAEREALIQYHSRMTQSSDLGPSATFVLDPAQFDPICSTLKDSPEQVSINSAKFIRTKRWSTHENAKGETTHCFFSYNTKAVIDTTVGDERIVLSHELWNPTASGLFLTSDAKECNEEAITPRLGL